MCRRPGCTFPFAVKAARAYRIRVLTKVISAGVLSTWLLPPGAPFPTWASLAGSWGSELFRGSISGSGTPVRVSVTLRKVCRASVEPTAQLPHVTSASGYSSEDATIQQKIHHDPLARLAEKDQHLGPRRPLKRVGMVISKDGEQPGDAGFVAGRIAMFLDVESHGFAEAVTKEVLRPRRFLVSLKEKPNGEIHNLNWLVLLKKKKLMSLLAPSCRTSACENVALPSTSESVTLDSSFACE